MFSLENYKPKRQVYICAFTTVGPIKDKMLHQLWVRALNKAEATGICMHYVWKHKTHIDMFVADMIENNADMTKEGIIEESGILYGDYD